MSADLGWLPSLSRYTVIRTKGCVVIEGAIPVMDFVALCRSWEGESGQGEWIVDALLAKHLGANFVLGPKAACELWRQQAMLTPEGPPGGEREAAQGITPAMRANVATARYSIVRDPRPAITCLKCGMTSYNPHDVINRFCGNCDEWMED